MKPRLNVLIETELGKIQFDPGPIENSEDKALAERRRQRRDAHVDLGSADCGLDTPILGQSTLGYIQPRHDLDARRQCSLERRGHNPLVLKESIEPDSNQNCVPSRLDVDV